MIQKVIRIGTRESQLAVWQATRVQELLKGFGYSSELVYIKSEGDTDLKTPLYEIGVQGIFTRALDIALLNGDIDIAVHSMKDVPTVMAAGIVQAAVLPRASYSDILVPGPGFNEQDGVPRVIGTSSVRRKAQWLHRYPADRLENLRGNVNTRLRKVAESNWHGAIFAAAGLERIGLRPENAISLDWMLPAPAQGAIMVVCKAGDDHSLEACVLLNDEDTALCTHIERQFLRTLMGGCTTPISALARVADGMVLFDGSILDVDGIEKMAVNKSVLSSEAKGLGNIAGEELLAMGAARLLAK
jgi:hydroxymethylbilane synthase